MKALGGGWTAGTTPTPAAAASASAPEPTTATTAKNDNLTPA
jgi:hypothetical protein